MMNRISLVVLVAFVAFLEGCERLTLKPEPVDAPLLLSGTWDGVEFDWNSGEDAMSLGADSSGSWCSVLVPMGEAHAELLFQVHLGATSSVQEALDGSLQTGEWPMHAMNQAHGLAELDGLDVASLVLFNGQPVSPEAEDLAFDFTVMNVLEVTHPGASCEAGTAMIWHPVTPCQTNWIEEPFSIEYENEAVVLTAPEDGVWQWQVDGGSDALNGNQIALPETNAAYTVTLQSADAFGPYGHVEITRTFQGHHELACDELFECEVEVESGPYLEVRLIMPDGSEYATSTSCSVAPGVFEVFEISPFEESGGWETRLVRFQCGLTLTQNSDAVALDIEEGALAFRVSN